MALKHMFENRTVGDLLVDVPQGLSWRELCEMAENRDGWRIRVKALRTDSSVQVTMNDSLPGCRARRSARLNPTTTTTKAPAAIASPRARKYIARDRHEAFFRPDIAMRGKRKRNQRQPKPKKKRKSPQWTNKQRATWAREHYQLHHGDAANASPPAVKVTLFADADADASPLQWTPHSILGHHHQSHCENLDRTTMPPIPVDELFAYFDDRDAGRHGLRNLSDHHPDCASTHPNPKTTTTQCLVHTTTEHLQSPNVDSGHQL